MRIAPETIRLRDPFGKVGEFIPRKLTPQKLLQRNVKSAVTRIEKEVNSKKIPPIDAFRASAILERLVETLQTQQNNKLAKFDNGAYPLIAQLIAIEVDAIKTCLSSSCMQGAQKMLDKLHKDGTVSNPHKGTRQRTPEPVI